MPRFDRTGPCGSGPLTGRGLGPCGRGMVFRRGFGQGGFGYGRWQPAGEPVALSEGDQKRILQAQLSELELEKKAIEARLSELEKA